MVSVAIPGSIASNKLKCCKFTPTKKEARLAVLFNYRPEISLLQTYPHNVGYRVDVLVSPAGKTDNDALVAGKRRRKTQYVGDGM